MVHQFGTSTAFLIFGEFSLIVLFLFIVVNNVRQTGGKKKDVNLQTVSKANDFK